MSSLDHPGTSERALHEHDQQLALELTPLFAHDLNNCLTAIMAQIDAVRTRLGDPQSLDGMLDDMESSVLAAAALARRLMTLGRSVRPASEMRTPIDAVVAGFHATLSHVAPSCEIHLSLDFGGSAQVQAKALERVLLNLVLNARDITSGHGRIRVSSESVFDPQLGSCVDIVVEDDGPGVPESMRAQIWEPYFTARTGGTGIGLASVARFALECGGTTLVSDSSLGGARIGVRIPCGAEHVHEHVDDSVCREPAPWAPSSSCCVSA